MGCCVRSRSLVYVGVHSSRLIEGMCAHVGGCIWYRVLDHKSVHISSLLLLYIGIVIQSRRMEHLAARQEDSISTSELMVLPGGMDLTMSFLMPRSSCPCM